MKTLIPSLLLSLLVFSCRKDPAPPPVPSNSGSLGISISYESDGQVLHPNTQYDHPAGCRFTVSTLTYYISGIKLYMQDGGIKQVSGVFYVNMSDPANNSIVLKDLATGEYNGISFDVGVDSANNIFGNVPNTVENQNMEWPASMGGGYHFMKLEGRYYDTAYHGYASHLGHNMNLVKGNKLDHRIIISRDHTTGLCVSMNIAEWYKNPQLYDFKKDGNYSMTVPAAMARLASNGQDVFSIKP